ncbi:MAG: AbrB/MazE/SpoVT family DNA-binding domain-containing protein [Burkholderiales bacterium]|nr:AbrB/MazE/SpoVT family DNA-binding domain-containing protein [Burkholderiales bacterium]MBZ0249015.1 AbrB/MazE/SpoVT family DNA-binding domain-containing protein [Burkholderiales bacterium]MCL4688932.1 AbrB/MazE/SpoVT family DNA-binding domain-containing protein [Burkholderiales bacterium]
MKVAIRRLGNSQGVIIPKPILAQVGLVAEAEMRVEKGAIVLEKPAAAPRAGWAEASQRLARQEDDALVWPEFENEADKDIKW